MLGKSGRRNACAGTDPNTHAYADPNARANPDAHANSDANSYTDANPFTGWNVDRQRRHATELDELASAQWSGDFCGESVPRIVSGDRAKDERREERRQV